MKYILSIDYDICMNKRLYIYGDDEKVIVKDWLLAAMN